MDPGTWKTIAQIAIYGGAVLTALGGLGNWYFGRLEDEGKEQRASQRHAVLTTQLDTLHKDNEALAQKLSPFEEMAKARFPGVSLDEALSRLSAELARVRELATRDIAKPLQASVRDRVITSLKALRGNQRPGTIGLHFLNAGARNAQQLIDQLAAVLNEGQVQHQVIDIAMMSVGLPDWTAYAVDFAPGSNAAADALIAALSPFLGEPRRKQTVPNLPTGRVDITIAGQPDFKSDGSVVLR